MHIKGCQRFLNSTSQRLSGDIFEEEFISTLPQRGAEMKVIYLPQRQRRRDESNFFTAEAERRRDESNFFTAEAERRRDNDEKQVKHFKRKIFGSCITIHIEMCWYFKQSKLKNAY